MSDLDKRTIQEAKDEGFDDVISRQADIDPCDTCEYNSLDWHEEPCESCTGEDNHWKPSASPTQTNASNALETLDCISRAAALNAIQAESDEAKEVWSEFDDESAFGEMNAHSRDIDIIKRLPSAQPYALDEWCDTCKEYDPEKHCCPRFNHVIRDAMKMRKRGKWIIEKDATGATYGRCSVCGIKQYGGYMNFCYECGADMRGGEDE